MFTDLIPGAQAAPVPAAQADAAVRFSRLLAAALAAGAFVKLLLSKPVGSEEPPERLLVREVLLRGERQLCFLWRYPTRDITKNLPLAEGPCWARAFTTRTC